MLKTEPKTAVAKSTRDLHLAKSKNIRTARNVRYGRIKVMQAGCFDSTITPSSIVRAIELIDKLMKKFEVAGCPVAWRKYGSNRESTFVEVDGQSICIKLEEPVTEIPGANKRNWQEQFADPVCYRSMGKFVLIIDEFESGFAKRFSTNVNADLNAFVEKFFSGLKTAAQVLAPKRLADEERAEAHKREYEQRLKEEAEQKRENERRKDLERRVQSLSLYQNATQFVEEFEQRLKNINNLEASKWLSWAKSYLSQNDPIDLLMADLENPDKNKRAF